MYRFGVEGRISQNQCFKHSLCCNAVQTIFVHFTSTAEFSACEPEKEKCLIFFILSFMTPLFSQSRILFCPFFHFSVAPGKILARPPRQVHSEGHETIHLYPFSISLPKCVTEVTLKPADSFFFFRCAAGETDIHQSNQPSSYPCPSVTPPLSGYSDILSSLPVSDLFCHFFTFTSISLLDHLSSPCIYRANLTMS